MCNDATNYLVFPIPVPRLLGQHCALCSTSQWRWSSHSHKNNSHNHKVANNLS